MGIIAAGQITVVDLSDAPVLNTFITASRPTTQTYSKDSRTYKPSYASTPQVLTLKLTKAGSTANIIDSVSSLHWFVVDGPIKTEITSKDNSANEYISGAHNEILTTKLDIDLNKGSKRYEVMGIWPDPSTGLDVQFGGYIDLLLTQNGATGPQGPQGDTGNGIANTVITYGLSMSDTTEPATWSSERPTLVKGMYLWTRTVIIYTNGSSTTSYQISYIAKDADATAEIDKAKQELLEKLETVRDESLEAVDEAKHQLVTVRDESLAAAEEAKQGLINVTSELNTAKQDLADSVTAVNIKVDSAKEELTQTKQQLTTVADDLSTAKQDFQNAVSAVDTKATNLQSDLTQAKQDLASQAQQLQEQATAQSELTNRVSSVEETANGTKTTVSELSKTVAQNGKDITSVTARTKVVEDDLSGTKTTLSQVQTTANSTSQKTATLETGLNGLSARFNSLSVGNKNYLPASRVVNRGCTNFSYSNTTKSWTMTAPASSSSFGNGITFNTKGLNILLNGGETLFFGLMIKANKACSFKYDVNNALSDTTSNDNDDTSKRAHSPSNKSIPANVWTKVWFSYTAKANVAITENNSKFGIVNNTEPVTIEIKEVMVAKSNVPVDYQMPDAELEQKVADYKQTADQNYASLQTTVQNLDGTVQHNKTVADQTAQGFTTRIESLETYKDGETTRANQYFESARTETARQLTAERTAIARDYVAKSTYTSDVTGIRNDLSATTTTANTIKTNLANYQASNDRAVANLQTNLQTANGNISSLKTKVEAVPGQITSAVSSVEGKIPKSVGGRNLALGTSADWSAGLTGFNGQNNQARAIYRIYNRGFKIGDRINIRLVLKYSDIVATEGQRARLSTQFRGNVTDWGAGQLAGGDFWFDKSDGEIEIKSTTVVGEYTLKNEYWEWRLRVDYVKSGKIQWKEAKAEVGDLPTPWSPAPEDTAEQISNLSSEIKQTADGMTLLATKTELNNAKTELQSGINTATNKANNAQSTANNNAQTISTHTTQISALNTGLQAKVSQSEFNTLSGRVTTAENNITAKANELSSKITSVEGKIPTSIGGRNLWIQSKVTGGFVEETLPDNHITGQKKCYRISNNAEIKFNIEPNFSSRLYQKVTFTAWVKYENVVQGENNWNKFNCFKHELYYKNSSTGATTNINHLTLEGFTGTSDWKRITYTYDYAANKSYDQLKTSIRFNIENARSGTAWVTGVKIEIGSIPSDYSPAPEVTDTQISSLSSELKQTKDGITLLATKTELNNAKNELQSGINTATNKANNNAQTISTHTNQISALNTGLQAKVSQSDFNTLSGRVTTAENNITAKANELSSKITSVEGKIPTNIGTVNLVKDTGSAFVMGYGITNTTWNETKKQSILDFSVPGVNLANSTEILPQGNKFCDFKPIKGTTYTQSIMIDTDATFNPNGRMEFTWFANGQHNSQKGYIKKVGAYSYQVWSTYTWNLENTALRAFDMFHLYNVLLFRTTGTYLAFYKPKLTAGNLPSDWSPSPEDTAEQISSLSSELKQTKDGITLLATKTELNNAKNELQSGINTATNKANNNAQTISTHTTQISALNTGLSAKVSQSDFNTLSGRVTNAENNITAKANELSSKITSVEGKIPTSVGGRNLWIQSKVTGGFVEETLPDNHITGQKKCYRISNNAEIKFNIEPNFSSRLYQKVTFTAWVKYENVVQGENNWNKFNCFKHELYYKNSSTGATTNINHLTLEGFTGTSDWKRITYTYDYAANKSYDQLKTSIRFNLESVRGGTAWVTGVKIEIGSIPSDYSPAPEDTISQISSLSSELKQTKDGITLLATKTELNTAKSDLQSGINTATNKANSAQNTANSAQSTANSAQNKANSNAQTINTHTNQISALNTGLSAKVSQSEFNTLSGRVTTAENNITAKANELSSKITKVEGKIPTSSGGRNLAQGTSKDWSKPFTGFSGNQNTCPNLYRVTTDGLVVGDTFKTRIVLKYTDIRPASGKTAEIWIQGAGNVTNWNSGAYPSGGGGRRSISGSGQFVFELTDKINADHLKNSYWNLAFRTDWIASGSLQWRLAKVERGMFFTDWSPAPEDTISQINSVSSEFKQTTDAIKASVTSLDKSTVKSSSLTINSDGIVMKAGKSTTDVANAIGSYFAVNQNAINLFSDKINVKGSMIVNGTITGDKIKASSVDVSKIVGIDANFIKSKIEYAMIDWLKGKTITAYNDNMVIDLQNGRISFKDGSNAVYRQTPDGIHTGFLHFEAGPQGGIQAAFGATSMRQFINSKTSAFAGIRCYRVSAHGDSHEAKIDKIELIGDVVQFGHGYASEGNIGGGFIMDNAIYRDDKPYSFNRMVRSIESLWRILHDHARNVGYNLSDQHFINALNDEYNAWYDMHNK